MNTGGNDITDDKGFSLTQTPYLRYYRGNWYFIDPSRPNTGFLPQIIYDVNGNPSLSLNPTSVQLPPTNA